MSIKERKLKSGRIVYDATLESGYDRNGNRMRETKTFDSRKDAEKAERENRQTAKDIKSKSGRLTLGDYISRCYWPITSRRLEATSLDTYEKEIRLRIMPKLGSMRLDKIDRYAIQNMLDSCATESVSKKALSTLKTILNEAVSDGFIATNPAHARFAHAPKGKTLQGAILTDFDQIREFTYAVQNDGSQAITTLVMLGLLAGLRPQERYALDYSDIDFNNELIRVNKAYVSVSKARGGHVMKLPKTDLSNRTVPMPERLLIYLLFEPHSGKGALIRGADGGRISPSTAQHQWSRFLDKHPDLPRVTLENMRHSYATACIHAGMPVADLSRILGHSDINTTYRRYVKPQFSDMQKSISNIEALDI